MDILNRTSIQNNAVVPSFKVVKSRQLSKKRDTTPNNTNGRFRATSMGLGPHNMNNNNRPKSVVRPATANTSAGFYVSNTSDIDKLAIKRVLDQA